MSQISGIKFDGAKRRMSLFPVNVLNCVLDVLEYGAKKYTKSIDYTASSFILELRGELELCRTVQSVGDLNIFAIRQKDCVLPAPINTLKVDEGLFALSVKEDGSFIPARDVVVVMTNGSKQQIRNIKSINEKITLTGIDNTPNTCEIIVCEDSLIHYPEPVISTLSKLISCKRGDLQNKRLLFCSKNRTIRAQSALDLLLSAPYISTMTIKQDGREVIFVVAATMVWECLTTLLQVLRQRYNIFPNLQQIKLSDNLCRAEFSGTNNWKHVANGEVRYYDAAMRHIGARHAGEINDPESKLPHLGHAMCCLIFWLWFDLTKRRGHR
jgi:hypothetical protein